MEVMDDSAGLDDTLPVEPAGDPDAQTPVATQKLVAQIIKRVKDDKKHHEKAFKRMRRDMHVAMWGADESWDDTKYRANIVGRHVKMKTAALYAKNPKAVARRRETIDFAVWDENPQSLMMAWQMMQAGMQAITIAQQQPPQIGPGGLPVLAEPQLPPGFEQAVALVEDFQQGMARRQFAQKYGKTLEILFAQGLREQKPLDFKRAMKQVVRRALTTGVGYVEIGFQREYGPRAGMTEKLADFQERLAHMRNLAEQVAKGDIFQDDGEMAELEASIASIANEPEVITREGLILDYPTSTKVIPDRTCKELDGFVGAKHLSIEYDFTLDEVREIFGVDMKESHAAYSMNDGDKSANWVMDDDYEWGPLNEKKNDIVRVWKHYDKTSGLVYYVADGHNKFLREPAAPDVFVEDFWPVYALTFNAVESEKELFPPSDVTLLIDMQQEYNRSRQGMREHRDAARPRWVYPNGAFGEEEDPMMLRDLKPFEALGLNIDPGTDISKVLQSMPVPGVDPNLYETGQLFTDMQLVGGSQEANYGGVAKATATESAIAANATNASDGSAIDDLDGFLTVLARSSGQILQREMSEEKVMEVVGPGAVWPEMSLAEIASEIFLEVEAGSTGKPNQAVEINNWQRLLPLVMQIPGISPDWLARETLRRLDDRMDLTEALASGLPSIAMMNRQSQTTGAQPGQDPNGQGPQGADNGPSTEQRPPGSDAAFGSNQTEVVPSAMM